jgi:hypothetical protein
MNWKKFLKPDWRKIVIFIIIFILLFFIPILPTSTVLPTPVGAKGGSGIVWKSIYSEISTGYGMLIKRIFYMKIPIIISLIISYLLSCLIVLIYDEVRKK